MFKTRSLINKMHFIGVFWVIIVGSLLHFTYEWSGDLAFIGMFSPVNESVWEHLKLGYFSLTFFMLIEYWILRNKTSSYFIAKTTGIISMTMFILIVHYAYEFIAKKNNAVLDVVIFIVGAIIMQIISMNIMKMKFSRKAESISFALFIAIGILFVVFTFNPPNLPIFEALVGNDLRRI